MAQIIAYPRFVPEHERHTVTCLGRPRDLKVTENVLIGALHDYLMAWLGHDREPQGFCVVPEDMVVYYRDVVIPVVMQAMVKGL